MIFRNWYFLSNKMTDPERSLEPFIAALGERYRSQWLFLGLKHIADFVLLDRKVVIEVDGDSHDTPEQQRKDILHTLGLGKLGYAVVRVSNKEALENPAGVIARLPALLAARPSTEALLEALAALPEPPPKKPRRKSPPPSGSAPRAPGRKAGRTA